jgi:hypothetical protein
MSLSLELQLTSTTSSNPSRQTRLRSGRPWLLWGGVFIDGYDFTSIDIGLVQLKHDFILTQCGVSGDPACAGHAESAAQQERQGGCARYCPSDAHLREAVADDVLVSELIDTMLNARAALWKEYCRLHDLVVKLVARRELCRRFYNVVDLVNRLEIETHNGRQGRLAQLAWQPFSPGLRGSGTRRNYGDYFVISET